MVGLGAGCTDSAESPLGPDPTAPTMSFDEARALLPARRYDDAVDALRPFVSVPTPETRALVAYARALLGAHRQSLAVWPLERARGREDAPPAVRNLYVTALLYGGAELEAIAEATRLLEENPEDLAIRELRAQAFEAALDLDRAVEDLEIVVDESPEKARLVERLLNLLIKIEDWDSARERIADLRTLLARDGATDEARGTFCATAARFEKDRGNVEQSEAELRACLEQYPTDANVILSFGELLDETGRAEEATAFLEARAETYPGMQLLRESLASRYMMLGRAEDADALLQSAAELTGHANAWLTLANLRLAAGNLEGTVEAVDRAVTAAMGMPADDPTLPWARMTPDSRFGIGDVYIRAGDFERAARIIESLTDEPAMALLLAARVKLEQGDPAGALADYQEAFKTFPSNPAARYLAGRAAIEVADFDLALDLYQDALRSDAAATDAGLVLAQMLLAEGRINWAIDTLGFYLASQREEPHAVRLLARAAAAGSMHKFAESTRGELSKNLDWAGVALSDQARDLAILNGPEVARDYLAASPELDAPTHFEAFTTWFGFAQRTGQEAEARARAARMREAHPGEAGPWIVHSRILFEDGDTDAAIAAMRKAIESNPLLVTPHAELGEMLLKDGQVDAALASLDRADALDPLDARAGISAAKGLIDVERYEEAADRLRRLLIAHPWHGRAALMLVDLAHNKQATRADGSPLVDDETAYRLAKQAARYIGVSGPRAQLELARMELARGHASEAVRRFEAVVVAKFDLANALHGLARAKAALGQREEALRHLESALSMPGLEDTLAATTLLEELGAGEARP